MRSQLVDTISRIIENDDNAVLLLGDIGVYGFRKSLNKYPSRAYNIGILEQTTIGVAAGLSLRGMIPIVHTIAPFLVERAFEQIKIDLCYQKLGANLISVGASYDWAALGPTHHCPADVGILNEIPGIEIIIPGHPKEFDELFKDNYNNGKTTYFRLSDTSNNHSYGVKFGKNIVLCEGKENIVIVAVGTILQVVLDAIVGIDVTVVYCTTVKPLDVSFITKFPNHKVLIFEHYYSGALLTNILRKEGNLVGSYSNIGVPNEFINKYGNKEEVDKLLGLDAKTIRDKIMEKIYE